MAIVISPAGTRCTAEGALLESLLAAGWAEQKPAPSPKKPAAKKAPVKSAPQAQDNTAESK